MMKIKFSKKKVNGLFNIFFKINENSIKANAPKTNNEKINIKL